MFNFYNLSSNGYHQISLNLWICSPFSSSISIIPAYFSSKQNKRRIIEITESRIITYAGTVYILKCTRPNQTPFAPIGEKIACKWCNLRNFYIFTCFDDLWGSLQSAAHRSIYKANTMSSMWKLHILLSINNRSVLLDYISDHDHVSRTVLQRVIITLTKRGHLRVYPSNSLTVN